MENEALWSWSLIKPVSAASYAAVEMENEALWSWSRQQMRAEGASTEVEMENEALWSWSEQGVMQALKGGMTDAI